MPKHNTRRKAKLPKMRGPHVRQASHRIPLKTKSTPGSDNPYIKKRLHPDGRLYGKYKRYPDSQILVEDLQAALAGRPLSTGHKPHFVKPLRDKSYTVFMFHVGARKLEPAEVRKEDMLIVEGPLCDLIVVNIPAFKGGQRADALKIPVNWAGADLIIEQWKKTRKGRKIWDLSPSTAYRIIMRALGKCPHWLRHNWITTMQQNLPGSPSEVDRKIQGWTGIKRRQTLDNYRMKKKEDITEISQVGLQGPRKE